MAKKPKPEGKKYNYMDTYGDLVTLLLCFFVLLFAMSTVEESKYNAFVEAMRNQFGPSPVNLSSVTRPDATGDDYGDETPTTGETLDPVQDMPADMKQIYEDISQYIEEQALEGKVEIEIGESGAVFIRLTNNLVYAGDSAQLSAEAMDFLDYMGGAFVEIEDAILQVDIIGHTASIQGSATDDWVLSNARAALVASYLERVTKFSPYKMHTVAYGRHYPIADNGDMNEFVKNRRVDIIVVGNNADNLLMALAEAQRVYFPDDDTQFFQGESNELPANAIDDAMAMEAQREVNLGDLTDEELREIYNRVTSN
ncbi:OmpA family protein [Ruminococcaceae bacterium OttesenSCG-928-D13]|nr:OmpA family protein [Ruminococcaceae bacterium OttesenSCG-928-D13]